MLKGAAVVFSCLLCCMLLVAAISSVVVFLYHHYYLRPHEMIVVDFRALSEAKLSQMVEDSRNGHPASATDIKKFIGQLHQVITEEAGQRPVYLAGAVFNPSTNLTSRVAARLSIDLGKAGSKTLPAMADRVAQSVQQKKTSPSTDISNPAQSE